MKIDHLVVNIEGKYQTDSNEINAIRNAGLPYEPKWGKGTRGFKASNIWIGNEYFELIHLLKQDGGGWKSDWVDEYNNGHRGLICLMLDVNDIDNIYEELKHVLTEPEFLRFKWGFGLFTRTMPWRNSYFPFFEGVPFQIGLQQMKDEKSVDFMRQYMVPNSRSNGINGIEEIKIRGAFTESDFKLIHTIFKEHEPIDQGTIVYLNNDQKIYFEHADNYRVQVVTAPNDLNHSTVEIENIEITI